MEVAKGFNRSNGPADGSSPDLLRTGTPQPVIDQSTTDIMEQAAESAPAGVSTSSTLTTVATSGTGVRRIGYPYKLLCDTREQQPYTFEFIQCDAKHAGAYLDIVTERVALKHGDYIINGFPLVVIERKSKADLYSSIAQNRDNFIGRLERMQEEIRYGAVVIEADWAEIIRNPPRHTKYPAKSLFRTIIAWDQRYPRVQWWPCVNRRMAELVTFRILDRGRQDQMEGKGIVMDERGGRDV